MTLVMELPRTETYEPCQEVSVKKKLGFFGGEEKVNIKSLTS
jgi:hypothetical protein